MVEQYRKVTRTFQGRQEAGPCACPCCGRDARILKYKKGEIWTTLICHQCGWYQVPTMHASPLTEFTVVTKELVERKGRAKK